MSSHHPQPAHPASALRRRLAWRAPGGPGRAPRGGSGGPVAHERGGDRRRASPGSERTLRRAAREAALLWRGRGLRLGLCWLLAAGAAQAEPPAVLDAGLATRLHRPLSEWIARAEPAPDEAVRVVEVGRDADASHHLVGLRAGETPHRHDRHDLLVVILRGHGRMQQGEEILPVGEGSIVYVPRGRVHAFTNAAEQPAVAYVVYHPPYDGEDNVPADRDADAR